MRMPPNRVLLTAAGILAAVGIAALMLAAFAGGPKSAPAAQATPTRSSVSVGARFAKAGDCLVNDGSADVPVLRLVSCAADAYLVLARVEGVTDADKACAGVVGYEYNYSYDSPLDDDLDFVLCLKSAAR
jgi:Flp pilus assembly protein CpaB